jgi:NAD(P)-dependent dehydrogenase (short-subunit alcohol dehydrogenase family)
MADKELHGRVAIVTGAGRNIGRGIALELAAAGAAVVVNVRSNKAEADAVVKEIEAAGGRAMAGVADVTDPVAVGAMASAALQQFGRIDYLVNNAALRDAKRLAQHHGRHPRRRFPLREGLPRRAESERRGLDRQCRGLERAYGRARPSACGHGQDGADRFHPRAGA